ncbi:adenylyl-sulfate kinase [Seleniivibrio woodruffii]|uniref:adenylyl-sulfate kinase n=1 Tax=Seleniivibrio woodruffii TaxID=1078050 RepID=UPI00240A1C78|nr:adenylyl-sulfate kinase [Seleniivibrio woodruffii]
MEKLKTYMEKDAAKQLIRFITCGSIDDGKSTLIGRLLHECRAVYDDQMAAVIRDSRTAGTTGDEPDLALIVDGLLAEREQGITIDVAHRYFSTAKRKFIILDTPGHEQYTRNMATGASNADLAVILIDSLKGISPQTVRHSYIVKLMGIKNAVVCVNKMDAQGYSQAVFDKIAADYAYLAAKIGLSYDIIPVSALKGDNITSKSLNTDWYSGQTLIDILESAEPAPSSEHSLLRLPVHYVLRPNNSFRGFCGRIESGTLSTGDRITVLPSGLSTNVKSLSLGDKPLDRASAPMSVTFTTTEEIDISRGDMAVTDKTSVLFGNSFRANLIWMDTEPLKLNKKYILKGSFGSVGAGIDKIYGRTDISTLESADAVQLEMNDIADAGIVLDASKPFDTYDKCRITGSFILIDRLTSMTAAAGMITASRSPENVMWHSHSVDRERRIMLKGHRPAIIWLTGLSGSGKSTIANALDQRLNSLGVHTYLLDGDNIRHGLCKDLGFSAADRDENIRRVGETAKLFADAGMIAIAAFISPFCAGRDSIRGGMPEGEFIEVFVDAPIEVCEERDPKNMYKKARRGEIKDFTGINSPYEAPQSPEIHIRTDKTTVGEAVDTILSHLRLKNII